MLHNPRVEVSRGDDACLLGMWRNDPAGDGGADRRFVHAVLRVSAADAG